MLHSPEMPGFSAAQLNPGWNTTGPVFPISGNVTVQANGVGPLRELYRDHVRLSDVTWSTGSGLRHSAPSAR